VRAILGSSAARSSCPRATLNGSFDDDDECDGDNDDDGSDDDEDGDGGDSCCIREAEIETGKRDTAVVAAASKRSSNMCY
jgi:hypothetical protein